MTRVQNGAMAKSTETEIAKFVAKYTPEMAREIKATRAKMRALVPRGYEMVYDNYNSLVFGFSPNERPLDAPLSLAAMPRWVTLCFLWGVKLKDPKGLLRGEGNQVRHVRLMGGAKDLEDKDIRALIDQALATRGEAFAAAPKLTTVIRSVSAKQRDRRPKGEG
ncbi:hypothetical protein BWI17_03930 [Betaproteobacteria bacterium GR16-43]|nr:hypothetical protein BWI17_03930 [Betaproteobacteria bacterium GR16-43]